MTCLDLFDHLQTENPLDLQGRGKGYFLKCQGRGQSSSQDFEDGQENVTSALGKMVSQL